MALTLDFHAAAETDAGIIRSMPSCIGWQALRQCSCRLGTYPLSAQKKSHSVSCSVSTQSLRALSTS
jgi:hypothetical protein